jgi:hypothetical protein
MVTINSIIYAKVGEVPIMPVHQLTAKKDSRHFKDGEHVACYLFKMTDGRFAVSNASFRTITHYEVFTEKELHDTFDEKL